MTDNKSRLGYRACHDLLMQRSQESVPGLVQLLVGPRQVGKTTLLPDLVRRLAPVADYVAVDGPEAVLPGFWERVWRRADALGVRVGTGGLLLPAHHAAGGRRQR